MRDIDCSRSHSRAIDTVPDVADVFRVSEAFPFDRSAEPAPPAGRAVASAGGAILAALARRMNGPGGYYNAGNLLGLALGLGVPLLAGRETGATFLEQFAGNPGAVAMSSATLVFFVSGELYYRAWKRDGGPDPALNRWGDLVSGVGSVLLGFGLLMFGHPLLAIAAGCFLAFGKFGSAFRKSPAGPVRGWPATWPDPFRGAVVAGRVPAILASAADFWRTSLFVMAGGPALALLTPVTMLVCQFLWVKADLILLHATDTPTAPDPEPDTTRPPPIRADGSLA